jgi:hypothetical protein
MQLKEVMTGVEVLAREAIIWKPPGRCATSISACCRSLMVIG